MCHRAGRGWGSEEGRAGGKFNSVPDVIEQSWGKGVCRSMGRKGDPLLKVPWLSCPSNPMLRITVGQIPEFIFSELLKKGHLWGFALFLKC